MVTSGHAWSLGWIEEEAGIAGSEDQPVGCEVGARYYNPSAGVNRNSRLKSF